MTRTRLIPLIAAAWLAAGAACSDSVAPIDKAAPTGPTNPAATVSLIGFVHLTTNLRGSVGLRTDDGQDILLVGAGLISVAIVDSVQVEVRGDWVGDGTFEVNDFVVRSVAGAPAMDGVLTAHYEPNVDDPDTSTLIGYDLQLTRGGIIPLMDPPTDLIAHLGARVWLTGDPNAAPTAFGIIS